MKPASAGRPEPDAAWWAVRLAADNADTALRAEAEAWVAEDPRRAGQLLRAQAMLMRVTGPAETAPPKAAERPAAAMSDVAQQAPAAPDHSRPWTRRAMIMAGGTLAAGLAAAALLLPRRGLVATDIGEVRRLPLEDGSSVALNTGSAVVVRFDDGARHVVLEQGEALFRVAKAPERPFMVAAGSVTVIAIGTIFAVRHRDKGIEVLVTEGLVEVRDRGRPPVRMKAGERGLFGVGEGPAIAAVPPEVAARVLAWRDGRLEFDGEAVAEAIAEVNRHNRRAIRLVDPALGREPVYGAFRTDDPSGFARAIGATLGEPVDERPREILIGSQAVAEG